jgi:hypothetical protein
VLVDLAGSVAWFPVWWYTKGFWKVLLAARNEIQYLIRSYDFKLWLKNFFVPMYGQYDLMGRLVSVFMRFVVLVGRGIALCTISLIYLLGIMVWLVAPVMFLLLFLSSIAKGTFFEQIGR